MAEIVEDIFKALGVTGSLSRQAMLDVVNGNAKIDNYTDILKGNKFVSSRELIDQVEKTTGTDLSFGDKGEEGIAANIGNFATDVVVDMFTDPIGLIGAPAKAVKSLSVVKNLNPKQIEQVGRATVGATFGALSIQDDDDIFDALNKVAVGAGVGVAGKPALNKLGKGLGKIGSLGVDAISEKINPSIFRAFRNSDITDIRDLTLTSATDVTKGAEIRLQKEFNDFLLESQLVDDRFMVVLKNNGLSDDAIEKALIDRDGIIHKGLGLTGEKRNALTEQFKKTMDDVPAKLKATIQADLEAEQEIIKGISDPVMKDAVLDHLNKNAKLIRRFNSRSKPDILASKFELAFGKGSSIQKSIDDLRAGSITSNELMDDMMISPEYSGLGEVQRKQIFNELKSVIASKRDMLPLRFHIIDAENTARFAKKEIDEFADQGIKLNSDATKARTSEISTPLEGLSREDFISVGAKRHADMFLSQQERGARQLLGSFYKVGEGKNVWQLLNGKLKPDEAAAVAVRGYDQMLNMIKTKHLVTGTSWVLNNYVDNIMKGYISGSKAIGARILAEIPAGAVGAAASSSIINKATLGLSGRAFKDYNKRNTFKKLMDTFDVDNLKPSVKYDDTMMRLANDSGAVDATQVRDVFELAKDGNPLAKIKLGEEGLENLLKKVDDDGFVVDRLKKTQKFFWNTVGRTGSAVEGTARYIVFEDTMKSLAKGQYPNGLGKLLNSKGGDKKLTAMFNKSKRSEAEGKIVLQARSISSQAAKIVNETFFDYKDLSAFERQVMKRIFPYWTFWSRNVDFWLDKAFDPNTAGKVQQVFKPILQSGDPLSSEEREGIPDFLLKKGVRKTGEKNGATQFRFAPTLSPLDAVKTATEFTETVSSNLSPIIKVPAEISSGKESFGVGSDGKPRQTFPSESSPKKQIFNNALQLLGDGKLKALGIFRDERGRLFTNSPVMAGILKVQEVLPLPFDTPSILAQLGGVTRDINSRDRDSTEAALEKFLSPIKTTEVSAKQQQFLRAKRAQDKLRFESEEGAVLLDDRRPRMPRSRKAKTRTRRRRRRRRTR